jgi:hypothetical protein
VGGVDIRGGGGVASGRRIVLCDRSRYSGGLVRGGK